MAPDDDYLTPHQAAERLYHLAGELEKHSVPEEHAEALRQVSLRFTRHLNGLEDLYCRLQDTARRLQW